MTTCPSGVDYRRLVDHARGYIETHHTRPLPDRLIRALLAFVLPNRARFRAASALGRIARPLAPLFRRNQALKPLAALLELTPATAARAAPVSVASPASGSRRGRVILIPGCVEAEIAPQIRAATVRLLTRAGNEVSFAAGEGCCSSPLGLPMGRETPALAQIRRNVRGLERGDRIPAEDGRHRDHRLGLRRHGQGQGGAAGARRRAGRAGKAGRGAAPRTLPSCWQEALPPATGAAEGPRRRLPIALLAAKLTSRSAASPAPCSKRPASPVSEPPTPPLLRLGRGQPWHPAAGHLRAVARNKTRQPSTP